jgi:hypothetical protein
MCNEKSHAKRPSYRPPDDMPSRLGLSIFLLCLLVVFYFVRLILCRASAASVAFFKRFHLCIRALSVFS